jgi:hypothetical protein
MSRYISFTKLKHLIFPNGGSNSESGTEGVGNTVYKATKNIPDTIPCCGFDLIY